MGECHYRSGNYEAINKIELINMILEYLGINTDRVVLEWASAAEGPLFVKLITEFTSKIKDIGTLGISEGLKREELIRKIKAASMAVKGMKVRMAFAKQAKQMKKDKTYGHLPSEEKLLTVLMNEMTLYETLLYLKENICSTSKLAGLMDVSEDQVVSCIDTLKKKKLWNGELCKA